MRSLMSLGLLVALAAPAAAVDTSPCAQAADLLHDVQMERFRLEGVSSKDARAAARFLKKGEKALGKLIARYEVSNAVDRKKLAFFAKAGKWIERAGDTGTVAPDAAPVTGWQTWFDGCMGEVDDFVEGAVAERDRLVSDKFRDKVSRRLEKGLAFYDDASKTASSVDRARLVSRAVAQIEVAFKKARAFCSKESKPNCPSGIHVDNQLFVFKGRRSVTVFDLEWHVTLRTREGTPAGERNGHLADPTRVLSRPLPWQLTRGDTLDALDLAGIPMGFGHRMDGMLTWTTSAGVIEVPLHINQ